MPKLYLGKNGPDHRFGPFCPKIGSGRRYVFYFCHDFSTFSSFQRTTKSEEDKKKSVNESLRQNLTKEMFSEVGETFNLAKEHNGLLSITRLPIALKALGMSMSEIETEEKLMPEELDLDHFIELVIQCMKHPIWAASEMLEAFTIFDKDSSGNTDPPELRSVVNRLGETLLETELQDQLREFDIDGDSQMAIAEFYKMVSATRGSDFIFDDNVA